jgi:hypothetical protein
MARVTAESRREAELRRLGVADSLVRLSNGEVIHDLFEFLCKGPPYFVYEGEAGTPRGPKFTPLWDEYSDGVVGVWERGDGLEFIDFSIESPDEYTVLSRTDQGLMARMLLSQFQNVVLGEMDWELYREPARVLGFRYFGRLVSAHQRREVSDYDAFLAFRDEFVARVDGWASKQAEPGAAPS